MDKRFEEMLYRLSELSRTRKTIPITNLIRWIEERAAEDSSPTPATPAERDHWHDERLHNRDLMADFWEGSKIVVDSAYQALKNFVFIAAGMAAAFLSFIGHVWKEIPMAAKLPAIDALTFFCFALVCGSLACGAAYLCHAAGFDWKKHSLSRPLQFLSIFLIVGGYSLIGLGLAECREMLLLM